MRGSDFLDYVDARLSTLSRRYSPDKPVTMKGIAHHVGAGQELFEGDFWGTVTRFTADKHINEQDGSVTISFDFHARIIPDCGRDIKKMTPPVRGNRVLYKNSAGHCFVHIRDVFTVRNDNVKIYVAGVWPGITCNDRCEIRDNCPQHTLGETRIKHTRK